MKPFFSSKSTVAMTIAAVVGLPVALHMSIKRYREGRTRSQAFEYYKQHHEAQHHHPNGQSVEAWLEANNPEQKEWWNDMVGYWQGGLNDNELRLIYRFAPEFGRLFTYSLDQGGDLLAATATLYNADTEEFRLYFETINGLHKAKLSPDGQHLQGTWTQFGRRMKLDMDRFVPSETQAIPRGLAFALDKHVTATNVEDLMELQGYWSGYLPNKENPDEDDAIEELLFVVMQIEGLAPGVVEPSIILPEESPFPMAVRNLILQDKDKIKMVVDPPADDTNAIYYGTIKTDNDGSTKKMVGQVHYDDTDYSPNLELVWSKDYPDKDMAPTIAIKYEVP